MLLTLGGIQLPPTLQLPTPPSTAICSSCAQSPSFTCLWCSSSDELAAQKGDVQPATLTQKLAPSSVDIAAGLAAASTTLSKGQVRGRASSHQPQASQSIPSRLTLDLRDETPLFGPFSTSLLQEETLNRKDGAILNETPLITPTLEGNDVAMVSFQIIHRILKSFFRDVDTLRLRYDLPPSKPALRRRPRTPSFQVALGPVPGHYFH